MKSPDTSSTDPSIAESGATTGRKRPAVILYFLLLPAVGLQQFFRVMDSPQAGSYRTIDIVRLLLAGACFGVVLVSLIYKLLHPRR